MKHRLHYGLLAAALSAVGVATSAQELPQRELRALTVTPARTLPAAEGAESLPPHSGSSVTQQWLQLQAQGATASRHPQQATTREREAANQRFLDSYAYPIPEYLPRSGSGSDAP